MDDVIQTTYVLEKGYLYASDAPGLGIDINEEAAAVHPPTLPDEPPTGDVRMDR